MRLYIAEKPSMGREIAACLKGPIQRKDGYLITGEGIVTWAFGHILRQAEPEEYAAKYKFWKMEDLPIIPQKWKMIISPDSAKQFNIIKGLIEKADEIVHAGDPDREGQLLIDEVLDYLGNKKPVKRILLNSLDEESIRQANHDLRDNRDFHNLKLSALARARADWLIGMNLSRAFTLSARRSGQKGVLPIGRVKTPTLALVVRREKELKDFKPVDYFTLKGIFHKDDIEFSAQWKPSELQKGLDSEGRLISPEALRELQEKFAAAEPPVAKVVSYEKKNKKESAPLPFSLSSLQVLAGKRFGYEPQLVLDTAQSLYEKKLTSYPRSDCEYLPLNQYEDSKKIIANITAMNNPAFTAWAQKADLKLKSRCWNDKKISAHHAIIPTKVKADFQKLTPAEQNIYTLILQAYIAQFYPLHTYQQTKIQLELAEEIFQTGGRVIQDLGWKELYQNSKEDQKDDKDKAGEDEDSTQLPPLKKGSLVDFVNLLTDKKQTKPPVRFTPSTLLAAMKDIHKFVKDEESKKKLKDIYGIGTEATRATIIEDLIKRKLLLTTGKKKYLVSTPAAEMMIAALPDEMTYPDNTAIWEDYLHSLSQGSGTLEEFLNMQMDFTRDLCAKAAQTVMAAPDQIKCPVCKQGIMIKRSGKNGDFWGCSNFPRCRCTANDENGKPVFRSSRPAAKPAASTAPQQFQDTMISAWDLISRENKKHTSSGNYPPQEKTSAAPLEKAGRNKNQSDSKYLCKFCREGHLRRIKGRNGYFWACSNYPRCTATYDDINNKPNL